MISCRNVMIYFQPVLRRGLFAIFHSALKNNGYLFLGKSETAGEYVSLFKPVCSSEKIYIHKGEGKVEDLTPPAFNIPNIQAISPTSIRAGAGHQEDPVARRALYHIPGTLLARLGRVECRRYGASLFWELRRLFYLGARPGYAELFQHAQQGSELGGGHRLEPLPGGTHCRHLYRHCGGLSFGPESDRSDGTAHPHRFR